MTTEPARNEYQPHIIQDTENFLEPCEVTLCTEMHLNLR